MKVLKECPILAGITTITVIITVISLVLMGSTYESYSDSVKTGKAPLLSMFFKGVSDGVYPWSQSESDIPEMMAENEPGGIADENTGESETGDGDISSANGEGQDLSTQEALSDSASNAAAQATETAGTQTEEVAIEEPEEDITYEFTEVDDDYFTDALFIGDSRTVGLSEYCEELDTRATFYSKISLTIYTALTKEFIKTDKGRINIEQALTENQFGKIYIMLGLNEIGTGTPEYFKNAYSQVIDRIRELQPDAIIYIQGIMHVTGKKSDSDAYFNNDNINERNEALSELADQKTVFYLNMNEAVDDENGNLAEELSFDDIHLKASSYQRWHEFLLHNAIVR